MTDLVVATEHVVHRVPVAQIVRGDNDRIKFEPGPLKELANSIARDGLTNPITIVPRGWACTHCGMGGKGPGPCSSPDCVLDGRERVRLYRISAGERRFRAMSDILGWLEVPAFIREMDREQESAVMLHENVGRVDLDPIEEGKAYQKRVDEFGWDDATIAERAGTTEANVKARRKLLRLVPQAQQLVSQGIIPLTHADAMAALPEPLQYEALKLLGKTAVPYVQFKQYLAQLEAAQIQANSLFDLTAFWAEQVERNAALQAEMRSRSAELYTSKALPPVDGDRKDTAGDIIARYMYKLHDAGFESEAAAVGNVLDVLLKLRKAKNFRVNPDFAPDGQEVAS